VRAARLTAAHNERELEAADLFDQTRMVKRVLINVDASPDARVVCTDGDDAERGLNALKMLLPKVVRRRLTYNDSFACLLAVALVTFDPVRSIGDVQAREYCFETCNVRHFFFLAREGLLVAG
jgi:hypothetical protein